MTSLYSFCAQTNLIIYKSLSPCPKFVRGNLNHSRHSINWISPFYFSPNLLIVVFNNCGPEFVASEDKQIRDHGRDARQLVKCLHVVGTCLIFLSVPAIIGTRMCCTFDRRFHYPGSWWSRLLVSQWVGWTLLWDTLW
jgi:hypothetical protein